MVFICAKKRLLTLQAGPLLVCREGRRQRGGAKGRTLQRKCGHSTWPASLASGDPQAEGGSCPVRQGARCEQSPEPEVKSGQGPAEPRVAPWPGQRL